MKQFVVEVGSGTTFLFGNKGVEGCANQFFVDRRGEVIRNFGQLWWGGGVGLEVCRISRSTFKQLPSLPLQIFTIAICTVTCETSTIVFIVL